MERAHHHRPKGLDVGNRVRSSRAVANTALLVLLPLVLLATGCSTDDEPTPADPSPRDTLTTASAGGDSILQATVRDGGTGDDDGADNDDDGDSDGDRDGNDSGCGPGPATEIRFRPGASSAVLDVTASADQIDGYHLEVNAEQILTIGVGSADAAARATVLAPDASLASTAFVEQTIGPTRAGIYEICVIAGSAGADYELFVSVIDDATPTRIDAPWCGDTVVDRGPIRFDPGSSTDSIEGAVLGNERDLYTVEAGAGQDIGLLLTSLEGNGVLDLRAPSGEMLVVGTSDLGLPLPADGVYQVCIGSLRGNASYVLDVTIM